MVFGTLLGGVGGRVGGGGGGGVGGMDSWRTVT